jgi:hypothetical protein
MPNAAAAATAWGTPDMNEDLRNQLHGHSVLVRSRHDRHNPPTALRGTIDARPVEGDAGVRIVLEYPDMFTSPAHQGIIELDDNAAERLARSEHEGVYEFEVDAPLEPYGEPPGPQAVS